MHSVAINHHVTWNGYHFSTPVLFEMRGNRTFAYVGIVNWKGQEKICQRGKVIAYPGVSGGPLPGRPVELLLVRPLKLNPGMDEYEFLGSYRSGH